MTTERLANATVHLFWPVFVLVAIGLIVWSIHSQRRWTSGQPLIRRDWGIVTTIAVALPLLYFLLHGAAFAYHDDDMLLEYSVAGHRLPLAIWPSQARYFPLFSQEFNVLSHIAATPAVYYGFIALELIGLCILLNMVLHELSVGWRTLATALVVSASGTAILFIEAIYPERNIVFLLALFLVALQRFDKQPSRLNMMVAVLAADVALYYKEPVFLLVGTLAVIRLVVAARRTNRGWRTVRDHPLELALVVSCMVFAAQFAALVIGSVGNTYVDNATVGPWSAATRYLRMEPLLLAFVAGIVLRVIRGWRSRKVDVLWDAAAAGAIVYFLALVATGLASDRYMGPVELIGTLFAVREVAALWAERHAMRRAAATAVAVAVATAAVAVVTVSSGAFRVVEHTSVVSGTEQLADFVSSYASSRQGQPVRLYFPTAKAFRIMNFASYLHYRHSNTTDNVLFASPLPFSDGRCVSWVVYLCEQSPAPQAGDLVVHLPDDTVRDEDLIGARHQLFRYSWLPTSMPAPIGRIFYVEAPLYSNQAMPKNWLVTTVEMQTTS